MTFNLNFAEAIGFSETALTRKNPCSRIPETRQLLGNHEKVFFPQISNTISIWD